jgi:hypothetical protein
MICGCFQPARPRPVAEQGPQNQPFKIGQAIQVSEGSFTRYSLDDGQQKLWSVSWKGAEIFVEDERRFGGEMREVTGEFYDGTLPVTRFRAGEASADRESESLKLLNGVSVFSAKLNATRSAQEVIFEPRKKLLKARGSVTVVTPNAEAGPFDEVWASVELSQIGTPDTFNTVAP